MTEPQTNLTDPIVSADSAVLFSAYGFGGYCAFALPSAAVCEQLKRVPFIEADVPQLESMQPHAPRAATLEVGVLCGR